MKYFGDPKFRKEYETQVATPVGEICTHCDEAIQEDDTGTMHGLVPLHYECGLRRACGSVGHQKRLCFCYGGNQEDPEGMTKREAAIAAIAAANYWHLHNF